ncbi:hypothetical protein CAAN1_03S05358 [[Candida] anglica]|uniref:Uncharacterized protein n=1 Tax=[Candida] anglica TaxID=148631 RepID=A0ABP0EH51_9ASCO
MDLNRQYIEMGEDECQTMSAEDGFKMHLIRCLKLMGKTLSEIDSKLKLVEEIYQALNIPLPDNPYRPNQWKIILQVQIIRKYIGRIDQMSTGPYPSELFQRLYRDFLSLTTPIIKEVLMYLTKFYQFDTMSEDSDIEYMKYHMLNFVFVYTMASIKALMKSDEEQFGSSFENVKFLVSFNVNTHHAYIRRHLPTLKHDMKRIQYRISMFHSFVEPIYFIDTGPNILHIYPILPTDQKLKTILKEKELQYKQLDLNGLKEHLAIFQTAITVLVLQTQPRVTPHIISIRHLTTELDQYTEYNAGVRPVIEEFFRSMFIPSHDMDIDTYRILMFFIEWFIMEDAVDDLMLSNDIYRYYRDIYRILFPRSGPENEEKDNLIRNKFIADYL